MQPANATKTDSNNFENLRTKTAYKILAMYSKNNDHAGPFSGCISVHPLISMDKGTGINVAPITIIKSIFKTEVCAIAGNTAPAPK